ncbi:MAG: arginine--tRNA ligase [Candidatus Dependentiae bacterium]|nr:arginine--tRNA ligase [Candidatus Dependentiae bacterium]
MNPFSTVRTALLERLTALFPDQQNLSKNILITLNDEPRKAEFGDLSTNAALVLAPLLKKAPRTVAQDIIASFSHPLVAACTIAGPGFINISLTPEAWGLIAQRLHNALDDFFTLDANAPRSRYSIEFVSANPTGPLHLGHGRGGIIGDVLGTILRFIGHTVTKEFYINDAGRQIDTLGQSFKIRCQQQLGTDCQLPEDGYHGAYLIDMAQALVAHDRTAVEGALESGNDRFFAEYAKERLLAEQQETLKQYGIEFDVWFSERTLHDNGDIERAIERLRKRGHLYEQDGALWFRTTSFGDDKDRVIRRANGELTYVAADLAYMLNKIERGAQKLLLVLGQDHHGYVSRLKGAMQAFGYDPDDLDAILYQLVTIKEAGETVRLSKRAGRIVSLEGIIDAVGKDVARFFYLNRKPDAHLDFDITLALQKTEENPVYYIQYAYVRTSSILEKAVHESGLSNITAEDLHGFDAAELMLLRKICALRELLTSISGNYQPHLLTYYVLELAHTFHSFYAANRVIDRADRTQSRRRLALIIVLRNTFGLCLRLLGLSCPEKM